MMGSGKSTIGARLARRLGFRHIDLDKEIESREKMSIPELFASRGEPYFRQLEQKILEETFEWERCVVSLGGGTIRDNDTVDRVRKAGLLIFLDAPLSVLLKRLKNDTKRPLLHSGEKRDLEGRIEALLKQRKPYYLQAHITIPTGQLSTESVTDTLIEKIETHES